MCSFAKILPDPLYSHFFVMRSINCELNIVTAFRQLSIVAVVGVNLPTVGTFLQRLIDSERRPYKSLIDVGRGDTHLFRVKAKFVISRSRIRLPLQFQILRTYFSACFGIEQFQISLEKIGRRSEQSFIRSDLVFV